jgi:DNA-binding MarR family transcriptional regulator
MEKASLVQPKRGNDEERVSRIYFTDKGRCIIDDLRLSMQEVDSIFLTGFKA